MTDLKKEIRGLLHCQDALLPLCGGCPYDGPDCKTRLHTDVLFMLKAQEPHILTEADFENADDEGYIPAWCEERNGRQYWECVPRTVLEYKEMGMEYEYYRYWSSRPTDEQREAVRWE